VADGRRSNLYGPLPIILRGVLVMAEDPLITQLNVIARLLETAGYAIEVNYSSAVIVVWLDFWPVIIEVKKH
jgi:hypothetical protein